MPKMGVDPEKLVSPKPQPAGWYHLKFKGFAPKKAKKDPNSINYNAEFEIVDPQDPKGQLKIFSVLSDKMARHINDVAHGLGIPLETNGEWPGQWVFNPKEPENVEKAQYKGPLLGRTMDAELAVTTYDGNERNEIRQIRCAVKDCAQKYPSIRHQTNMISTKK